MTTTTPLTKITTASLDLDPTVSTGVIKSDCLGRIHVSKKHRSKLLDAFDSSGMSGVKFAAHYGIKYTTFASWIQKRRRERNEYPGPSPKVPSRLLDSLAEVTLVEESTPSMAPECSSTSLITLKFPNGSSLDIGNPDQARIAAVLLNNLNDQSHA